MTTHLDHLVVAAATLDQGIAYVRDALGIEMPAGGAHPRMGTHNHLLRLGPSMFLEVIAIDPSANAPDRPRWFGLDDPWVRAVLAHGPRLLTWVVNTADIDRMLRQTPFPFGAAEPMSRGELHWLITIRADGSLPAAGMLPALMQWDTDIHPASRMPDSGCSLIALEIHHPQPGWLESVLQSIAVHDWVELRSLPANASPYLLARIETPSGVKQLTGAVDRGRAAECG